jgi:hypothetical protein
MQNNRLKSVLHEQSSKSESGLLPILTCTRLLANNKCVYMIR